MLGALREALIQEACVVGAKSVSPPPLIARSIPSAHGKLTLRVLEPADPAELDKAEDIVEATFVLADLLIRVVRRLGRADVDGRPVRSGAGERVGVPLAVVGEGARGARDGAVGREQVGLRADMGDQQGVADRVRRGGGLTSKKSSPPGSPSLGGVTSCPLSKR